MTREEAKYHLEWIPHFDEEKFVDEIYDDIESRVCGNCEFYINNEYSVGCSRLGLNYNQPTFGCNEFVGKVESK